MKWILNLEDKDWKLTTEFWESRPLEAVKKTHNHGAWDIAPTPSAFGKDKTALQLFGSNSPAFYAPESGYLVYFSAFRNEISRSLQELGSSLNDKRFFDLKYQPYFYDVYGGLVILKGDSGLTHIFTHVFTNQLFNLLWRYWENRQTSLRSKGIKIFESPKIERFPLHSINNFLNPIRVDEKDPIGLIGNAGFSTGYHIHYEIHKGDSWQSYLDRVDPLSIYPSVWKTHENDHRVYYQYEEHKKIWSKV
jgi:hypothetical protein